MKKIAYLATTAMTSAYALSSAAAAIDFDGGGTVSQDVTGATAQGDQAIQVIVGNVTGFLAILAVLYLLFGGFQILTAAGDDEKVTKGRKVIIQAALGLVVIWLANSVVSWLLWAILTNS